MPHFSEKNISSICGRSDNWRRRALMAQTAAILKAHDAVLNHVMEQTGLTESNLSGMFHCAGKHLPSSIGAVVKRIDRLARMIKEGPFTTANLTNIFNNTGQHLGEAIDVVESHMEKLKQLAAIIAPSKISSRLRGATVRQLPGAIDYLLEEYADQMLAGDKTSPASDVETRFAARTAKSQTERAL